MRHFDRIFQLLRNPEDSGSGGGAPEWPEYEVPQGVGAGEGETSRDASAGPTSAGNENAPGGENQPQASHDGAGDPQPSANAPTGRQPNALPQGRLEQELARSNARYTNLEQRFQAQNDILTKLQAVFAPPGAGQKTDPRTLAVRNRMLEVLPELKDVLELAARREELNTLLERAPGLTHQETRYWDNVAARTIAAVHAEIAPFMLGDGGTADKMTDDQKDHLRSQFRAWCLKDEKRVDRYERGDEKIVEEFRDYYVALNYAPSRRQAVLSAASRAAAGAALPRAGRADAAATSVPKVDPTDDDAAHTRGWQHVQNAFAGARR